MISTIPDSFNTLRRKNHLFLINIYSLHKYFRCFLIQTTNTIPLHCWVKTKQKNIKYWEIKDWILKFWYKEIVLCFPQSQIRRFQNLIYNTVKTKEESNLLKYVRLSIYPSVILSKLGFLHFTSLCLVQRTIVIKSYK